MKNMRVIAEKQEAATFLRSNKGLRAFTGTPVAIEFNPASLSIENLTRLD